MAKAKLKGSKTKGVWLEMVKPVRRFRQVLTHSTLGVLVDDAHPHVRHGKELFSHVPKFRLGRKFVLPYEGMYTVREINSLVALGYYKLLPPRKAKRGKKA